MSLYRIKVEKYDTKESKWVGCYLKISVGEDEIRERDKGG